MPTLRQLEYLVAVADARHFRRAAERTNTTQPTLSEQIKALEGRLGVQLIERSRSRVVLTPIGLEVVEVARRMLKDSRSLREMCSRKDDRPGGVLRLGVSPTVGPNLLPRVIPELHRVFPDLRLYVREDAVRMLPRGLDEAQYDAIVAQMPIRGTEIDSVVLYREPLLLAMAADDPLVRKSKIGGQDLADRSVLALGPAFQLHDVVVDLCQQFGAKVRYDYEGTSLDTLREMVAMGMGVTFLPGLYVRTMLSRDKSIVVRPLDGGKAWRDVGMAWRKTSARAASFRQIATVIKDTVKGEFAELEPVG